MNDNRRDILDDGLFQQRQNLLWAIVRQAFRDAKRGDILAIEFCYAIALRPSRLERALMMSFFAMISMILLFL